MIAASWLAACQPQAATPGTARETTIRVWGFSFDDTRAKARFETFQKQFPNIKVETVPGTVTRPQLLTAVVSGDAPEVVRINRVETASWAARQAIDPIDDLVDRDKVDLSEFQNAAIEQSKYKGKLYGLPEFAHVEMVWLNLQALNEAGVKVEDIDTGNWEKMQEIAERLHKREGDRLTRLGYEHKINDGGRWYMWSLANGHEAMPPDGLRASFNHAKFTETLQWAKGVLDRQGGEKGRLAFLQAENFFSAQNYLLTGQAAMRSFESWLIGTSKLKPEAVTAVLLRKRNSRDPISTSSGAVYSIPRGVRGDKREAAFTFLRSWTSADAWIEGEKAVFKSNQEKNEKYHPTHTGNEKADPVIWNEIYKPVHPNMDAMVKLWPEARRAAITPPAGPVQAEIDAEAIKAVNDVMQGARTPQKAAEDLQNFAQKAIDDFAKQPGNR
jgi:multiple sugar transport system substrate-binding protein